MSVIAECTRFVKAANLLRALPAPENPDSMPRPRSPNLHRQATRHGQTVHIEGLQRWLGVRALGDYIRRSKDHIASVYNISAASLHKVAVPQAEKGNWFPMHLLLITNKLLTKAERELLSQVILGKRKVPRPVGHPKTERGSARSALMALHSHLYEHELRGKGGALTPAANAIRRTSKVFGVSRTTVTNARKQWLPYTHLFPGNPKQLRLMITALETESIITALETKSNLLAV
jgi:hypothetical protein